MNDRSRAPAPRPPLRARLRALAAEAILDAAEDVFAEQGLNAGMDAIAAKAGVAVGTLYNHFKDRESLVRALLDARSAQLLGALEGVLEESDGRPFRDQLVAALRAMAEVTERHAAFRRMAFQTDVQRPLADRLQFVETLVTKLGELLRRGEAEGVLAPDPDGLLPAMLLGLLHGAFMIYLRDPARLPPDRIPEVVAAQFLDGAARRVHA